MTDLLLGLGLALSAGKRDRWPWADDVMFWATNIGLIGFVIGLAADQVLVKRLLSPLMGIGILVGLAALALRLRHGPLPLEAS